MRLKFLAALFALGVLVDFSCMAGEIAGRYVRVRTPEIKLDSVKLFPAAGRYGSGLSVRFVEYRAHLGATLLELREGDVGMREPSAPGVPIERAAQWSKAPFRATLTICAESNGAVIALMVDRHSEKLSEDSFPGVYLSLRGRDRSVLAKTLMEFLQELEISLDGNGFVKMPKTGLLAELQGILESWQKD